jgi:hypothetical protein
MRFTLLMSVMLSNFLSLITASNVVQTNANVAVASTVDHAVTESDSKAEMQAILKLQFAEPLPKVIARAHEASKTMHVSEALQIVGHKMSTEVRGLLEARNTTQLRAKAASGSDSGLTMSTSSAIFDKAMGFINDEYVKVREELDLELLACGFYKLEKEALLFATQDKLDELAMDMGLAEATMGACTAEIAKQNDFIDVKEEELMKLTIACKIRHDELEAIRQAAEEDYRVITMILEVTEKDCAKPKLLQTSLTVHACLNSDGMTHFETSGNSLLQDEAKKLKKMSNQQAFQLALYQIYGMDQQLPGKLNLQDLGMFDDQDDSDDFPPALLQSSTSFVQTGLSAAPDAGTFG